ncbi:hypothetical protein C8Q78DRAFT_1006822 [Trametes maxima]|nr:hypothetical protein C8Q78DRAFT_1006822 [Trametes maxima]
MKGERVLGATTSSLLCELVAAVRYAGHNHHATSFNGKPTGNCTPSLVNCEDAVTSRVYRISYWPRIFPRQLSLCLSTRG